MPRWQKGQSGNPRGRPPGRENYATVDVRQLARELVLNPDYRARFRERLMRGHLAPAVELALLYYAFGRPVERVQVENTTTLPPLRIVIEDATAQDMEPES